MIGELTNHLWQSTLFAVAAGLLTAAFRGNKAQVRHWLWFSASLKFLLPFALLMSLGSHLQRTPSLQQIAAPAVSETALEIAEPFSIASSYVPSAKHVIDWTLIAIFGWACGFAALIAIRLRVWLRIRAAVRASCAIDLPASVEIRQSPGLLEPGVVGFFRPVLLLPAGIVERLTPLQLKAVLAHEMCHVRRRDNLTSAIHMIVEAIFWFHPFVWWIERRMLEERERACDEAVLSLGGEPRDYAEGILGVCKLYVESPLVCVSGVTGANLKRRIEAIITNRTGRRLNRVKKLVLACAGAAVLVGPVVLGLIVGIGNSVVRAQSPVAVPAPVNAPVNAPPAPQVTATMPAVAAAMPPVQDHRLLALLFDFGAMTPDQQSRARQAAIRFVRNQMGASDRVAVMTAEGGKATVVSDFTDDKSILESAILKLNPGTAAGSPLSGVQAAVRMIGALPGKKELIYLAPTIQLAPDNQAEIHETVNAAIRANVAIYPIDMNAASFEIMPLRALGGRSMAPQPAPVQTPTPPLEFEVASVKPAAPLSRQPLPRGGPGSSDPSHVRYTYVSLKNLLLLAYGMPTQQITGPAWIDSERYDIAANVPAGATMDQVNVMLRNLLTDRFQLVVHRETRELQLYELTVAKKGLLIKPYVEDPNEPIHEPGKPVFDKNGVPILRPGGFGFSMGSDVRELLGRKRSIEQLALILSNELRRPVVDKTGLTGDYDYSVKYAPNLTPAQTDGGADAPDLLVAVQEQLGLKLESKKGPIEMLVVDGGQKTPTEN